MSSLGMIFPWNGHWDKEKRSSGHSHLPHSGYLVLSAAGHRRGCVGQAYRNQRRALRSWTSDPQPQARGGGKQRGPAMDKPSLRRGPIKGHS